MRVRTILRIIIQIFASFTAVLHIGSIDDIYSFQFQFEATITKNLHLLYTQKFRYHEFLE